MKTEPEVEKKIEEKIYKLYKLSNKVRNGQQISEEEYKKLQTELDTLKWVSGYYGPSDWLDF